MSLILGALLFLIVLIFVVMYVKDRNAKNKSNTHTDGHLE